MSDATTTGTTGTTAPARDVEERRRGEILLGGGAAGLAGGALMAAFMVLAALVDDRSALSALDPVGLTFLGEDAVEGEPLVTAYGIVLLLAVSALCGAFFTALLAPGFPTGSAAVIGIGYAWFAMAIAASAVLPSVNPTLRDYMPALGGSWVIAIALYGAALGAGPRLRLRARRWLAARRRPREREPAPVPRLDRPQHEGR